MKVVHYGFWCVLISLFIAACLMLGTAFMAVSGSHIGMVGVLGFASLVGALGLAISCLQMVASVLFCFSPEESEAKSWAIFSCIFGGLAMLLKFAGWGLLAGILGFAGQICMLVFLRTMAYWVGRADLADMITGVVTLGCLSVVLLVTGTFGVFILGPFAGILAMCAIVPMILALLRYCRAISGLVDATKEHIQ